MSLPFNNVLIAHCCVATREHHDRAARARRSRLAGLEARAGGHDGGWVARDGHRRRGRLLSAMGSVMKVRALLNHCIRLGLFQNARS